MGSKVLAFLDKFKVYFSRKFLLAITCLAFGWYLILENRDVSEWATLCGVVLAFYNGSNVAEKYVDYRQSRRYGRSRDEPDEYNPVNPEEGY